MAKRSKVKDLVILIPGIMGTRLLHNGVPIWGDDSRTFIEWVRRHGEDLGRLSVGPDDPDLDDLGDGITAEGIVPDAFVAGRFLKAGGYTPLLRFLEKGLGLRPGRNLQVFAYDWRRDLVIAARRLATRAEGWLRAWQASSGNPKAGIVLLCHAMGGLVGRYYVDVEGGWPQVRQLVCIGAPFLGSVRALDLLYFGADFQNYGLPFQDITPIARTFTSVYQLLPHYPSIETFAGEIISPFDVRIPTFEHLKMERSRQFHRNLIDHHARNRTQEGYERLRSTTIAGIGQPTVEQARLLANGTLSVEEDPRAMQNDGDGAVPRFSAEAAGAGGFNGQSIYMPQTHGMLACDPVLHGHLRDLLVDRRAGEAPPQTPLPRFTLRRTVHDQQRIEADTLAIWVMKPFYRSGQSAEIRVLARSATGHPFDPRSCRLTVKVEHVSPLGKRQPAAMVRMAPESRQPGWFLGRLRTGAPGTYRATVTTSQKLLAPFRVSDFFEVDSAK